jgi:hypothetical protein
MWGPSRMPVRTHLTTTKIMMLLIGVWCLTEPQIKHYAHTYVKTNVHVYFNRFRLLQNILIGRNISHLL